jgi:hypothetical protein
MKAAIREEELVRPGLCWACSAFKARTTLAARVVLPEPGMPETAMRRRWEGARDWYFSLHWLAMVDF